MFLNPGIETERTARTTTAEASLFLTTAFLVLLISVTILPPCFYQEDSLESLCHGKKTDLADVVEETTEATNMVRLKSSAKAARLLLLLPMTITTFAVLVEAEAEAEDARGVGSSGHPGGVKVSYNPFPGFHVDDQEEDEGLLHPHLVEQEQPQLRHHLLPNENVRSSRQKIRHVRGKYKYKEEVIKRVEHDHPCKLTPTAVKLTFPGMKEEVLVSFLGYKEPNLMPVNRCKGLCSNQALSPVACIPTKRKLKKVKMQIKTQYLGKDVREKFREVVIEEHEECGCRCLSVMPEHCMEPSLFNNETCSCKCDTSLYNRDQIRCETFDDRRWDPVTCTCRRLDEGVLLAGPAHRNEAGQIEPTDPDGNNGNIHKRHRHGSDKRMGHDTVPAVIDPNCNDPSHTHHHHTITGAGGVAVMPQSSEDLLSNTSWTAIGVCTVLVLLFATTTVYYWRKSTQMAKNLFGGGEADLDEDDDEAGLKANLEIDEPDGGRDSRDEDAASDEGNSSSSPVINDVTEVVAVTSPASKKVANSSLHDLKKVTVISNKQQEIAISKKQINITCDNNAVAADADVATLTDLTTEAATIGVKPPPPLPVMANGGHVGLLDQVAAKQQQQQQHVHHLSSSREKVTAHVRHHQVTTASASARPAAPENNIINLLMAAAAKSSHHHHNHHNGTMAKAASMSELEASQLVETHPDPPARHGPHGGRGRGGGDRYEGYYSQLRGGRHHHRGSVPMNNDLDDEDQDEEDLVLIHHHHHHHGAVDDDHLDEADFLDETPQEENSGLEVLPALCGECVHASLSRGRQQRQQQQLHHHHHGHGHQHQQHHRPHNAQLFHYGGSGGGSHHWGTPAGGAATSGLHHVAHHAGGHHMASHHRRYYHNSSMDRRRRSQRHAHHIPQHPPHPRAYHGSHGQLLDDNEDLLQQCLAQLMMDAALLRQQRQLQEQLEAQRHHQEVVQHYPHAHHQSEQQQQLVILPPPPLQVSTPSASEEVEVSEAATANNVAVEELKEDTSVQVHEVDLGGDDEVDGEREREALLQNGGGRVDEPAPDADLETKV